MRFQKGALVAAVAVLALAGCNDEPRDTGTGPSSTTNINNNNIFIGGNPTGSPSPGVPGTCVVDRVRNGFFGIGCPSGVNPRNGEGVLPLGCVGNSTATPKRRDGSDASQSEHGTGILWAVTTGPERVRMVDVAEPFNKNFIPVVVGDVTTSATLTAAPGCGQLVGLHNFVVTAATSTSFGDVRAASVGDELDFYRDESRGEGEPVWRLMGKWRVGSSIPKAWRWEQSR